MPSAAVKLLVSVRNADEARVAVAGGADIVDVKEPDVGPLGFAGFETIRQVVDAVADRVPVSAAYGECVDWSKPDRTSSHAKPRRDGSGLAFRKLGLAGMLPQRIPAIIPASPVSPTAATTGTAGTTAPLEHLEHWVADWSLVRQRLHVEYPTPAAWVAVAYADHGRATAPSPWSVLDAAVSTECSILLVDTFVKDGQGTLHWLSVPELQKLRAAASERGLQFALAGQLSERHLSEILRIAPDILAVRGAVCAGSQREATLCPLRMQALRKALIG